MEHTNLLLRRIQKIRKLKQRNLHDCAAFLQISKEDYLQFEQGALMISLPEIELLAHFLGVSPSTFFQKGQSASQMLGMLDEQVQPQFLQLRHKMIQAKIAAEMQRKSIQPEQIQEQADITQSELEAYIYGEMPIPLDHLLAISDALGFDLKDLLGPIWFAEENTPSLQTDNKWQHEFSLNANMEGAQAESAYHQLLSALQALPIRDQAEVAKILLEKLKSIMNG